MTKSRFRRRRPSAAQVARNDALIQEIEQRLARIRAAHADAASAIRAYSPAPEEPAWSERVV